MLFIPLCQNRLILFIHHNKPIAIIQFFDTINTSESLFFCMHRHACSHNKTYENKQIIEKLQIDSHLVIS